MQSLLTQNSLQGDSDAWSNPENVTMDTHPTSFPSSLHRLDLAQHVSHLGFSITGKV